MIDKAGKPYSKLGIVAFVFGLMPSVGAVLILLGAGTPGRTPFFLVVSGGATILVSSLLAFSFGLASLFQKRTARVFGVVGFVLGVIEVISIIALIVVFAAFMEALGIALGSGFGKM